MMELLLLEFRQSNLEESGVLNRFKEQNEKPETNKILIGTEPETETKSNFIIKNLKWSLITIFILVNNDIVSFHLIFEFSCQPITNSSSMAYANVTAMHPTSE